MKRVVRKKSFAGDSQELIAAIEALCTERKIEKDVLFDALEAGLVSAFRKNFASAQNVLVDINRETGVIKVYAQKEAVEEVEDEVAQISVEEAKTINANYALGDTVNVEVTPANFGRIAALTARQIVTQRIREAERNNILSEYAGRERDIITGTVSRNEGGKVYLEIGDTEALLTQQEMIPGEAYKFHTKMRVYILRVESGSKGVTVLVSRAHAGLVRKMFEVEVPEIAEGVVEIKGICREAGSRTKVSVYSNDENVDAQGACIGAQGRRVQILSEELCGEKLDIIKWSADPAEYIAESLSPAEVISVELNARNKSASVVVPDDQLSLAIGKSGQNVRLAAKLTGWKIDITSENGTAISENGAEISEEI